MLAHGSGNAWTGTGSRCGSRERRFRSLFLAAVRFGGVVENFAFLNGETVPALFANLLEDFVDAFGQVLVAGRKPQDDRLLVWPGL